MRPQDAPGDTPRFEQAVAQQHRVADGPPYRPYGVAPGGDTLNEYRVDPHAYQNQHPLEAHGEQGAEIVLPGPAQLPVRQGRHGEGRKVVIAEEKNSI